jgi:hypothetical protein
MDFGVNPCDDFYSYSCGGWINSTKLPPSLPILEKGILSNINEKILSHRNNNVIVKK